MLSHLNIHANIEAVAQIYQTTPADRLSRFSKIAGEMVPHIRIEEVLHQLAGVLDRTFVVTAVSEAKRGEKIVVLHTYAENLDELHRRLADSGLPNLWVPEKKSFYKIDALPMPGAGKLDMAALKKLALEKETSAVPSA